MWMLTRNQDFLSRLNEILQNSCSGFHYLPFWLWGFTVFWLSWAEGNLGVTNRLFNRISKMSWNWFLPELCFHLGSSSPWDQNACSCFLPVLLSFCLCHPSTQLSRASLPQFRTSPNQQKKVSIESVYAVFPFTHYFPLLPLSRAQKI